jgi:hypothetical protein
LDQHDGHGARPGARCRGFVVGALRAAVIADRVLALSSALRAAGAVIYVGPS